MRVGIGNINSLAVLREVLASIHISTNQFANVMGLHRSTLGRYLSGEMRTPRHVALAAITVAMNCGVIVVLENPAEQLAVAAKRARIT